MASRCEAPLFAGRETLPPLWDTDLVGKRLVQAFVTLDRLPRLRGPRAPGGHWPRTVIEWADQLAQAELEESERRTRQQAANRTVIRPSAAEITHMEAAFEWLSELRVEDFWHGACHDPLGVARRARKIDQEALHRKAMGAAYFLSQASQGLGEFGGGAQRAWRAGFLGLTTYTSRADLLRVPPGRISRPHTEDGSKRRSR